MQIQAKFHDVVGRRANCCVEINLNEVDVNNIIIANDFIKSHEAVHSVKIGLTGEFGEFRSEKTGNVIDVFKNENFVKEILVIDDAFYISVFGIDTLKEYESMPILIDDHDEDDGDQ